MKRVVIIALFIFLLTGCNFNEDKIYSVDVDVTVYIMDMVEVEDNPGVLRFTIVDQVDLLDTFNIIEIEKVTTVYGEFPSERKIIDKNIDEYRDIIQELFDEISDGNSLGGDLARKSGAPLKLIITMQSDTDKIIIEFFQDDTGKIVNLLIQYIDSNEDSEIKDFNGMYSEIYLKLDKLIE